MGKRFRQAQEKLKGVLPRVEDTATIEQALKILLDFPHTKFDETVDVAYRLGVDPKKAEENIRGAVTLPHGLGKKSVVVVFAKGEKVKEAEEAGADHVGAEDLVEKIQGGWTHFTAVVATPDMMGVVSKLGRVLGPKGLMPNPKVGTVTFDLKKTIQELKKGRVEFRAEKAGIIHAPIGKVSFGAEKLKENFLVLLEQLIRMKPASAKGDYICSIYISTTMSPSIKINHKNYMEKEAA